MRAWKVVHSDEVRYSEQANAVSSGLRTFELIGAADGAVHLQVALSRLEPSGTLTAHVHPFEESFYVLDGEGVFTVADQAYQVSSDSYGFAPIRTPHRWTNTSSKPAPS